MSVPKSKRKESRFEAQHNLYILRKEVTNLVVADFGFSEEKYLEQMERYRAAHRSAKTRSRARRFALCGEIRRADSRGLTLRG